MRDKEKIKLLRQAVMVAVVQLYEYYPKDVLKTFALEELENIVNETELLRPKQVEDIYYEALKSTEE